MTPEFFLQVPLKGALKILPTNMDSPAARAMVIAICLQESKLTHRRQVGGPARGFAQFEQGGGVVGVLTHPQISAYTKVVCASLDVAPTTTAVYAALEQNDVLAAALARLLLWTVPETLPIKSEPEKGWSQYILAWRPGKPHKETWAANFAHAWDLVEADAAQEVFEQEALLIQDAARTFVSSLTSLQQVALPPAAPPQ